MTKPRKIYETGLCAVCKEPFRKWRPEQQCCSRECGYKRRRAAKLAADPAPAPE